MSIAQGIVRGCGIKVAWRDNVDIAGFFEIGLPADCIISPVPNLSPKLANLRRPALRYLNY
jgi:hypothetical protein